MEVLARENVALFTLFGHFFFFGEYFEMVISHLQVDQIWFPFLASHKDCVNNKFSLGCEIKFSQPLMS